ncbi:type I-E CRISPR-associated endoribonuclease Cas2 [Cryobacterium sp. TMS1-13-1]|uniref:type I-E CRISPR-associated endoribonuclease Cas2 n=1 Tax=Cryobacterium sp. TMS1-13-1 TaxID=1259220 RepID=UPI00106CD587|nr:type I-E CRISPR-associated endoribonuclease Cas2 [Cryobacterium sp. TMS1-13-1]TFD21306.1 hypothetical protein E3T31_10755 [Cryobacterium sp. TMS1-13-1]
MAYSPKALQYASIGAAEQVRLTDRVSYLYLEYAQIVQGRTGVLALQADESGNTRGEVQIPVGSIAVVMLGPGTSITAAAAASLAAAGAVVMFNVLKRVAESLWVKAVDAAADGVVVMVTSAPQTEQGFRVQLHQARGKDVIDFDGISLMRSIPINAHDEKDSSPP